jgi:hypothetical protein
MSLSHGGLSRARFDDDGSPSERGRREGGSSVARWALKVALALPPVLELRLPLAAFIVDWAVAKIGTNEAEKSEAVKLTADI